MGVNSEISLAETEYTMNCTFKIAGKNRSGFENEVRNAVNVVDFRVVPDTEWLYENDISFRKLVKIESVAKRAKQDYINKHNKR